MKCKSFLVWIPVALLLLGTEECPDKPLNPLPPQEAKNFALNLTYVRDPRTDLCFAVKRFHSHNQYILQMFTDVPCDKVQNYLEPRPVPQAECPPPTTP